MIKTAFGGIGSTRPIVPLLVHAGGVKIPSYALLDSGANCSAITETLCQQIKSPISYVNMKLSYVSEKSTQSRPVTNFSVSSLTETYSVKVEKALISNLLSTENENPPHNDDLQNFAHL